MKRLQIAGRMTGHPEAKEVGQGTMMAKFTVAVNSRKKQGGEWVDHADFFNCTAWGNRAENVIRNGEKGRSVVVFGDVDVNRWEDNEGQRREQWGVRVDGITYTGPRRDQAQPQGQGMPQGRPELAPAPAPGPRPDAWNDDDLPF